jgi:hypothetical protein
MVGQSEDGEEDKSDEFGIELLAQKMQNQTQNGLNTTEVRAINFNCFQILTRSNMIDANL